MNIKEEEYDFLDGEMFLTNNKGKLGELKEIRLNKRANPDNMPVEDRLIRNQRTNGLWEMNEKIKEYEELLSKDNASSLNYKMNMSDMQIILDKINHLFSFEEKMTFNTLGFLPTFSSLFEGVSAVRSNCFRTRYN